MKSLGINLVGLENQNFNTLLKSLEKCATVINHSRAIAFKIVSIIDTKKLWQDESNYSAKQIEVLLSKGMDEPWRYSLKDVLENLYGYFSWSQYVKYGFLSRNIELSIAQRLTENSLMLLNRNRDHIHSLLPEMKKLSNKPVITEEDLHPIIDNCKKICPRRNITSRDINISLESNVARNAKKQGKIKELVVINNNLSDQLKKAKNSLREIEKKNVDLRTKNIELKKENQDFSRQLRQFRNSIRKR